MHLASYIGPGGAFTQTIRWWCAPPAWKFNGKWRSLPSHSEIVFSLDTTRWALTDTYINSFFGYAGLIGLREASIDQLPPGRGKFRDLDHYLLWCVEQRPNLRLSFSSSEQDRGVRFKLIDYEPAKWRLIDLGVDGAVEMDCLDYCKTLSGRYDWLGLGQFVLKRMTLINARKTKARFCSDVCEDVLVHAGVLPALAKEPPSPWVLERRTELFVLSRSAAASRAVVEQE